MFQICQKLKRGFCIEDFLFLATDDTELNPDFFGVIRG